MEEKPFSAKVRFLLIKIHWKEPSKNAWEMSKNQKYFDENREIQTLTEN
jgi:hypothetical protein